MPPVSTVYRGSLPWRKSVKLCCLSSQCHGVQITELSSKADWWNLFPLHKDALFPLVLKGLSFPVGPSCNLPLLLSKVSVYFEKNFSFKSSFSLKPAFRLSNNNKKAIEQLKLPACSFLDSWWYLPRMWWDFDWHSPNRRKMDPHLNTYISQLA